MAFSKVYTIGFTRKSAGEFFGLLRCNGVERLLDVRVNNTSQLAGFAKKEDLRFFLRELCDADYLHEQRLAPTQPLLKSYRKGEIDWPEYQKRFLQLMQERRIEKYVTPGFFDKPTVLLCSEATAEQCHRRLVLEYLQRHWGRLDIIHL